MGRWADRASPDHGTVRVTTHGDRLTVDPGGPAGGLVTHDVAETIRQHQSAVIATLYRMTGSFEAAEDAFAEATLQALSAWPRNGTPTRPGAWLTTVARRKSLDTIRRERQRPSKERAAAAGAATGEADLDHSTVRDDQLRLYFICCNPALAVESQIALALRLIAGIPTQDIAAFFFDTEDAVGKRITRAKAKIRTNRIPYRIPPDHELPARIQSVLHVVHLIYTKGHHEPSGPTITNITLTAEAVRLARQLTDLMPDEPECIGLLALLLATESRAPGRIDEHGDLIRLEDADRTKWDSGLCAEATELAHKALRHGRPGPMQLQAAISCLHATAPTFQATDWSQIATLYAHLGRLTPSIPVMINHALAIAHNGDTVGALRAIGAIDPDARPSPQYHLALAHILKLNGQNEKSDAELRVAAQHSRNIAEQRHISTLLPTPDQPTKNRSADNH
jgi:RNA polymerase sigma-70 factor, ECF subfamily